MTMMTMTIDGTNFHGTLNNYTHTCIHYGCPTQKTWWTTGQ